MSDLAIRVEGLSKRYRIGPREPYKALRDTIADFGMRIANLARRPLNPKSGKSGGVAVLKSLQELIEQLPPELQQEVRDFAEFLLKHRVPSSPGSMTFEWQGALRDLRDRYTSVELQHKILEWWGEQCIS